MNLAPVVDVNNNPQNPVIGIRSYGDTPELVAAFGKKALQGYKRAGIAAVLKHYPGHGDVGVDSHDSLPVVNKSVQELERIELFPFRVLAKEADAVMTAHLLVPALDAENCSTLSKKTIAYLKEELGFQGVVMTDSLMMGALSHYGLIEEVAIKALNAGCDLLLFGGRQLVDGEVSHELSVADICRVHKALVDAVKTGVVVEERVDDAVRRVLQLKQNFFKPLPRDLNIF
jgi:beta-N-acetylhexosaminidase